MPEQRCQGAPARELVVEETQKKMMQIAFK
jgi:hypothetical protein